jgi:hypothetical protein
MPTSAPQPIVVPHATDDYRWVDVSELTSLKSYDNIMGATPNSSIKDFAWAYPNQFLKSTSKWNEHHLIAFKYLLLENLPESRIVLSTYLPNDDDELMRLVHQYFVSRVLSWRFL